MILRLLPNFIYIYNLFPTGIIWIAAFRKLHVDLKLSKQAKFFAPFPVTEENCFPIKQN